MGLPVYPTKPNSIPTFPCQPQFLFFFFYTKSNTLNILYFSPLSHFSHYLLSTSSSQLLFQAKHIISKKKIKKYLLSTIDIPRGCLTYITMLYCSVKCLLISQNYLITILISLHYQHHMIIDFQI